MPPSTGTDLEAKYREDLRKVCNLAYKRELVSGSEGNFSLKINDGLILVTPRNSHKGSIETSDFVVVDIKGSPISNGSKQPTSELALHLEVYKRRPDVMAVVHAHPLSTVTFSVAGLGLSQPVIPEIVVLLGEVPTVPYREPGSYKLAELAGTYLERHDSVILEKHGAVTLGKNIFDAYLKMESLEHAAKIVYNAHVLGEIKILDEVFVEELIKQRHQIYGKELELREGTKLFQATDPPKLKGIFKKLIESDSPVFQRVLNLVNELMFAIVQHTAYSKKLSSDEKEQLSRELSASLLSMILGKFIKK